MPMEKTFFAAFQYNGKIYTFGGYDAYDKQQLRNCEYYDIKEDKWYNANEEGVKFLLHEARSQNSCCQFGDELAYIFGGYHKDKGTLSSIEKFNIRTHKIELLKLTMPEPLRRFASIKISTTKILLMGGIMRMNKESDAVFCFDLE